jgi:hypothetical protein
MSKVCKDSGRANGRAVMLVVACVMIAIIRPQMNTRACLKSEFGAELNIIILASAIGAGEPDAPYD